jgi:lipid II:glycine glycyltransferase (peptidoglycan interpeptide bridge formation enzyme)
LPTVSPTVAVRTITPEEHLAHLRRLPAASFLQTPAWGRLKNDWRAESIGWYAVDAPDRLVGSALVLYRQLPRLKRYLAYLPEGPVLDWDDPEMVEPALSVLRSHLAKAGAFAIRLGPPVPTRRWSAETVKEAIASDSVTSLTQVPADADEGTGLRLAAQLERLGYRHLAATDGFAAGQPQFVFQIPLAGRSEADLLAGMNQLWRRNIKKADKAGVVVTLGGVADLPAFHGVYLETATRDHFTPRPLFYFQRMFTELLAEDPDRLRLYLAHHEGDLVAATIWVRVGGHAWYSYGASTSARREVQGSTALQWRMLRDSLATGATVYDLRGITDTVASDDPHLGLIRFKVGTGGEAVEYVGEWDLPLNKALYAVFDWAMRRRS